MRGRIATRNDGGESWNVLRKLPMRGDTQSARRFVGKDCGLCKGLYELVRSRASQVSKTAIQEDVGEFGYPEANACPPS